MIFLKNHRLMKNVLKMTPPHYCDFLKILYNERDKKLNQNYIAFSKKNVWANWTILDPKMVHRRKPGCNLRNFKKILNNERQL